MNGSNAPASQHSELTQRIAKLETAGGGTLELGDGIYGIDRPLHLPRAVSLCMTQQAVIRALPGFQGEAVLVKDAGREDCHESGGWIRGGVIDGGRQPLTGLKVERVCRMEIADLEVRNATYKGIHIAAWYEVNLNHVRCNVDLDTRYAPGSVGIHYESGDSQVHQATVIGYETGVRSDCGACNFSMVHVWNWDETQGPMLYCFYCNGSCDTYFQCYADSPTIAGFHVTKACQSIFGCRTYYSRWAADNAGAGVLIGPEGTHGTYIGNGFYADPGHTLAKAYDGNLEGACILGDAGRGGTVHGGMECRIPSGGGGAHPQPPFSIAGNSLRLTPQAQPPAADQGQVGDMVWVDGGETAALYLKTSGGWKRARLE